MAKVFIVDRDYKADILITHKHFPKKYINKKTNKKCRSFLCPISMFLLTHYL